MSPRRTLLRGTLAAVLCAAVLPAWGTPGRDRRNPAPTGAEAATAAYMEAVRTDRRALRAFLHALPKGADLHNHLGGAASTELLVDLAARDGLCIEKERLRAVPPPCPAGGRPAADVHADRAFHRHLVRAWSMQDFRPGRESGHDHFFATFEKFEPVEIGHMGRLLSEVADRAAAQHQFYLETMVTHATAGVAALAARAGFDPDLGRLRGRLLAGDGLGRLAARARAAMDRAAAEFRAASRCGTRRPRPGCGLEIRFITQVDRSATPEQVFTELLLGFELARTDRRFVSVNLVSPEDGAVALRDYGLHMRMLHRLHAWYPRVPVTLHAGELAPGLVGPEDLRSHIRQAVLTGHARRIGHGVDVGWEDASRELLAVMAERRVLVEIPLVSNAQILGVAGRRHPFELYREHGVPVALATDDAGVERSDITTEYERAVTVHRLGYRALKDLARTSLEYGFLPGRSLWRDRGGFVPAAPCARDRAGAGRPRAACAALLGGSPKAAVEWKQEAAFGRFEERFGRARSVPAAPSVG
ncbi:MULTISPECIES: adenosine deaminase family protein [Streptomyces]|uniref:adenosine deaminase family protein n=1 Tax=Streptomyces TaxID=1883 RepID=UPI00163B644E|nr:MULTISPECIES: adenosine deaminase [Streptomyces]MBC2878271.1 adenosine deaminase [Streptomyces sp. TYQ1024]UBI40610.1 adenosine deaminase [Streptomyces mobaraensis]UKW33192.1 adenosine deaminase [Streptomyces sp. TYQ1024]